MSTGPQAAGEPAPDMTIFAAVMCDGINPESTRRLLNFLLAAANNGAKQIRILLHSNGGSPADGLFIYELIRKFPVPVTFYGAGNICSAAVLAFLGAPTRIASPGTVFLIHRTVANPALATSERLGSISKSVLLDDARSERVLKDHVSLSSEQWAVHQVADLWLSAEEAAVAGLCEIGHFVPQKGAPIHMV